jgi:hypothetical protein
MSATLTMARTRHQEPEVLPFALALAVAAHVAIAWLTPAYEDLPEPPPLPLEVDLNPQRVSPPKPVSVPEAVHTAKDVPAARHVAAPAKAAAGKLLTALAPPVNAGDAAPIDFVTDPNGKSYGFGVVSRGGTSLGEGNASTAIVGASPGPQASAPALANAADLSERPRLLVDDPCRGSFHDGATSDSAAVVVRVVIEPSGKVRTVTLVEETPSGQHFGAAARSCIRAQRFSIPRDHDGRAVATATNIRVRFER